MLPIWIISAACCYRREKVEVDLPATSPQTDSPCRRHNINGERKLDTCEKITMTLTMSTAEGVAAETSRMQRARCTDIEQAIGLGELLISRYAA